ncbi:hypothetical protein F5Y17DRAFT_82082 [Xylariaceae sp. FL0594]|nr:hypothetical protein F5Y17DRAFT_82082 [Xylariaceae sp. FL0594]
MVLWFYAPLLCTPDVTESLRLYQFLKFSMCYEGCAILLTPYHNKHLSFLITQDCTSFILIRPANPSTSPLLSNFTFRNAYKTRSMLSLHAKVRLFYLLVTLGYVRNNLFSYLVILKYLKSQKRTAKTDYTARVESHNCCLGHHMCRYSVSPVEPWGQATGRRRERSCAHQSRRFSPNNPPKHVSMKRLLLCTAV